MSKNEVFNIVDELTQIEVPNLVHLCLEQGMAIKRLDLRLRRLSTGAPTSIGACQTEYCQPGWAELP